MNSCDLVSLTKLVTSPTCSTKTRKLSIDLTLTKKGNCFQRSKVTGTGLSNFHELSSISLLSHFSPLNPEAIYYRNYEKFNEQKFLEDIKNATLIQTSQTGIIN